MPYRVFKRGSKWYLEKMYRDDKNKNYVIKKEYLSRDKAINAAKNFIRFRKGTPVIQSKNKNIIDKKMKKTSNSKKVKNNKKK